jgi:hypothetical protein
MAEHVTGVIRKVRQFKIGLAVLGFVIAASLFAYLEFTNYSRLGPALLVASVILCPPSLMSLLFLDAEPHTSGIAIVWAMIGLINALLYWTIGRILARFLWRYDRLT